MSLVGHVAAVVDRVADEVVIHTNFARALETRATVRAVAKRRYHHPEAVVFRAPRVGDILQGHVVGVGKDDAVLANVLSASVTTQAILQTKMQMFLFKVSHGTLESIPEKLLGP